MGPCRVSHTQNEAPQRQKKRHFVKALWCTVEVTPARAGAVLRGRARLTLCFLPWGAQSAAWLWKRDRDPSPLPWHPEKLGMYPGLVPTPLPSVTSPARLPLRVCMVTVPSHPAELTHVCAHSPWGLCWGEQAGLKGSLFPYVIIPELGNGNVLKTSGWTFPTGAGPLAAQWPHCSLLRAWGSQPTSHPRFPRGSSLRSKARSFAKATSILGKMPPASPCPGWQQGQCHK